MNTIKVIGLGAADFEQLPIGVYRELTQTKSSLYARTLNHPVIQELQKEGIVFESFDGTYESHEQFEDIYKEIVSRLLKQVREKDIIYVVPGHPMLAERTVQLLIEEREKGAINLDLKGGQSFLDATFTALEIDPIEGFQFVDATDIKRDQLQYLNHLIFCQVYDALVASEVKLTLLEDLPADHPVTIVTAAGSKGEGITTVPLEELDRSVKVDNLTSVYVPPVERDTLNHQFFRLREVIKMLRSPEGCPWDRKQTHESLRKYMIEEAYEFIDAVNRMDDDHMVEELGDVLLQVMLHSQIGEDEGFFTIDDVIVSITNKMIRRHPHVFGEVTVDTSDEVVTNWEAIKVQEKGERSESILDAVPQSFPALLQAEELQKKAAKVGFDWDTIDPIIEKVEEEWQEFQEAREDGNREEMEKEFGDWLFAIANLARHYKLSSENALQRTNRKFRTRLSAMEKEANEEGMTLEEYHLDSLEELWIRAKVKHKGAE
ncbi:bifunctional methyltransferase/pyrophosphohydrolase YabN [Halobacillus karajensis]|uniref:Nucleoside triphosphate pyrophosphohydrolase n=1 Tax=Halobacillus karajensis TaxID=195088 RepID=A0A024PA27_9BACI|nr:nucleoside triphosphate pyrophosphohydrolase [Halobacillus karajensis]CDQ21784.1 Nucleoside triphosphate pyrophosphohydrolase [Halobacillus karajensis]CDQ25780.1 Nucleoside triphosphate pyrophosphohydrolase [Halobacillus karajensis]CDQ29781.1 Nucleoside triphosphate pyrophosphohydrolase [Halobacillus karajensis]